ncbi:LAETG motif-containing sortase-dependent surface protein [Streptomyces sp. NPDC088785]|uniref:LAETG motif-containing sortase-dependent surface protein n=1 Tax=Streptomyces sp. NPDC088785 TaxID=3365897 RepID=UPI00381ED94F
MTRRVAIRLAGTTASAALLALSVSGVASAHGGGQGWKNTDSTFETQQSGPGSAAPSDKCAFSADGSSWTGRPGLRDIAPDANGKLTLQVKGDGSTCTVSLASYLAHGPDFKSSGVQQLLDHASVSVQAGQTAALSIAVPDAVCFAQLDLYRGTTVFDGKEGEGHGPVPAAGKPVIGSALIASWNGPSEGGTDCIANPPKDDEEPSTPPATTTPGDGATTPAAKPTPAQSAEPSDTATTAQPASPAASSSSPAAAGAQGGEGDLAQTGSDNTGTMVGGAVALLLVGGGAVFLTRRKAAARRG